MDKFDPWQLLSWSALAVYHCLGVFLAYLLVISVAESDYPGTILSSLLVGLLAQYSNVKPPKG